MKRLIPLLFLLPTLALAQPCYIQRAFTDGKLSWNFEYNDQNQVTACERYNEDGSVALRMEINYQEGTDWIQSVNNVISPEMSQLNLYTRDESGMVTRMDRYSMDASGEKSLLGFYTYLNDPSLPYPMRRVTAHSPDGTITEITDIELLDNNGTTLNTKTDADGNLIRTEKWVRDNRKTFEVWTPFPYHVKHNLVGKQVNDKDGNILPQSYGNSCQYNLEGYPVVVTERKVDGSKSESRFVYKCQ